MGNGLRSNSLGSRGYRLLCGLGVLGGEIEFSGWMPTGIGEFRVKLGEIR
jgi:hypothetical protein